MRRDVLIAIGLVLAAVAEVQWAATFYTGDEPMVPQALLLFLAGVSLLLAAAGHVVRDIRAWAVPTGLGLAAAAHLAYFAITLDFGTMLVLAALLAGLGLAAATWGAWQGAALWVRIGLGVAALGGVVWTYADVLAGETSYMVGNIFATVGWGMAAWFAGAPE